MSGYPAQLPRRQLALMQAVDQQALVPAGRFLRCQGRFLLNEMFQQLGDALNWGESAIAPDAVRKLIANGLRVPFYFEYELRARHPQGSPGPAQTLRTLLLVPCSRPRPAPVLHHAVRGGRRGRRGNLREHGGPHELDVPAHPGVVPAGAVPMEDTGEVLAAPVGTGIPPLALSELRAYRWVSRAARRCTTAAVDVQRKRPEQRQPQVRQSIRPGGPLYLRLLQSVQWEMRAQTYAWS